MDDPTPNPDFSADTRQFGLDFPSLAGENPPDPQTACDILILGGMPAAMAAADSGLPCGTMEERT